jgi:hypothetical protein
MSEWARRALRCAMLLDLLCLLGCGEASRTPPPSVIAAFSLGDEIVLADQWSDHLLSFHALGERGDAEVGFSRPFQGSVSAVRCIDAQDHVLENGECGDDGLTLIACMHTAQGFAVQCLGRPEACSPSVPVNVDCSHMVLVDRHTVVLTAPALYVTGVTGFLQAAPEPFASVVYLGEGAGETRFSAAAAPVGAESDALRRVDVFPNYAALVFNTYVGVVALRSDESASLSKAAIGQYHFIDLFESELSGPNTPVEPSGAAASVPLVAVADGTSLLVVRQGSRNLYSAPLPAVDSLRRLSLSLPVRALLPFALAGSDRLLALTDPDPEGKSHLQVIRPSPLERARNEVSLPAPADTLATLNSVPLTAGNVNSGPFLAWNSAAPNDALSVISPELVAVADSVSVRSFRGEGTFTAAAPLGSDLILLFGRAEGQLPLQFLARSDGTPHHLLESGERAAGPVISYGPYLSVAKEVDGVFEQVFSTLDGVRTDTVPLHGAPLQTLKNSACGPCCNGRGSCDGPPLRMAVLLDHPMGELQIISGLSPTLRASVTGFLGTANWRIQQSGRTQR